MSTAERTWRHDLARAHAAIPTEWVWTDPVDGWQGIDPARTDHPLVQHYRALMRVGYARGWMRPTRDRSPIG